MGMKIAKQWTHTNEFDCEQTVTLTGYTVSSIGSIIVEEKMLGEDESNKHSIHVDLDILVNVARTIIKYYGDDYGDKEYEGEDLRGNPKTLTNTIKTQDKSTYALPKYPPTGE